MTAGELIAKLSEFPADLEVQIFYEAGCCCSEDFTVKVGRLETITGYVGPERVQIECD